MSKIGQQLTGAIADRSRCDPIDSGGSCSGVAPHPVPRNDEKGRVIDEVGQVIEAAAGIGHRPTVQLGLHRQYPGHGLGQLRPRCVGVHRRPPDDAASPRTHWTHSPCDRLSRPRTTTGPPPHPTGVSQRRAFPPGSWLLPGKGTGGMVPTFTPEPFDGVGAQLCPRSIATATPQAFTVASRPATSPGPGVPRPATSLAMPIGCALQSSPDPPGWSWGLPWGAFSRWFLTYAFPSRLPDPSHLAVLTRPVVVRAASALLRIPGIELPSASPSRCDGPAAVSFHHRTVQERLVALEVGHPPHVRLR